MPGWAEHHRVPRRPAAIGVRGGIARPRVRFDLGELHRDQPGHGLVFEDAAEQIRGDLEGVPGEELPGNQGHDPVRYLEFPAAQPACSWTVPRSAAICSATRSGAVPP